MQLYSQQRSSSESILEDCGHRKWAYFHFQGKFSKNANILGVVVKRNCFRFFFGQYQILHQLNSSFKGNQIALSGEHILPMYSKTRKEIEKCETLFSLAGYVGRKAMVAHTKPQQRKKEECERPRVERDQIKFIDFKFKSADDSNKCIE